MDLDLNGDGQLKEALKQALVEIIQEQPEIFAEVLAEALENFMLSHGIRSRETTEDAAPTEAVKTMARGA